MLGVPGSVCTQPASTSTATAARPHFPARENHTCAHPQLEPCRARTDPGSAHRVSGGKRSERTGPEPRTGTLRPASLSEHDTDLYDRG